LNIPGIQEKSQAYEDYQGWFNQGCKNRKEELKKMDDAYLDAILKNHRSSWFISKASNLRRKLE
jgi:hypothetical protein